MTPVYISGLFEAPIPEEVDRNVARACALGRYALWLGHVAVVPHAIGRLGGGAIRRHGGVTLARMVASYPPFVNMRDEQAKVAFAGAGHGELWVLLGDDGTMSAETRLEHDAFVETSQWTAHAGVVRSAAWRAWVEVARGDGFDLNAIAAEILGSFRDDGPASGMPVLPAVPVSPVEEGGSVDHARRLADLARLVRGRSDREEVASLCDLAEAIGDGLAVANGPVPDGKGGWTASYPEEAAQDLVDICADPFEFLRAVHPAMVDRARARPVPSAPVIAVVTP